MFEIPIASPIQADFRVPFTHPSLQLQPDHNREASSSFPPRHIQKSTVLADAGFEILYGTDDRVFGNLEPKSTVRRAGRVCAIQHFHEFNESSQ